MKSTLHALLLAALGWVCALSVHAAQPTVVSYGNSSSSDDGNIDETVAGVSWQTGDIVVVLGSVSNNEVAGRLSLPTVTGLTFSQLTAVNNDGGANDCQLFAWSATAAGTSSGTVTAVTTGGSGLKSTIAVFVFRGSDGLGTPVTLDGSTAKTISVTRGFANSHVVASFCDWNQVGDVTVDATPTGTVRLAAAESGQADFFFLSWGDQGGTGSTSYGLTNHTGTVDLSGIAIEVRGTAGGGGASPVSKILQQH